MCIRDLMDQLELQGAYCIQVWKDKISNYEILAQGDDFRYDGTKIEEDVLYKKITCMYATDEILYIEVEE